MHASVCACIAQRAALQVAAPSLRRYVVAAASDVSSPCAHVAALPLSICPLPPQVNASDTRSKSDASATKGVAGKLANAVKELSTNTAVSYDKQGRRQKVGGLAFSGVGPMLAG